MKRKVLEDFFTPIKKLNPISDKCRKCGEILLDKNSEHSCKKKEPVSEPIKPKKSLPDSFQILMSTCQRSTKANFHLEYLGKLQGKHIWKYLYENPLNSKYKSKVHKLKQNSQDPSEILLTFTTNHIGTPNDFYGKTSKPSLSPGILKSVLQKAVRRKNRNSCLKTALQLSCNCGIKELTRRLCVIVLEDTILHKDFPLLVWCMGVDDYEYSKEMFESIMQIVSDLAEVEYVDILEDNIKVDVHKLWKNSGELVKSMLVRGFYRGMGGDVAMLNGFAETWHKRLQEDKWVEVLEGVYKGLVLFKPEDVAEEFTMNDVLIEGIDHHCTNIIEYLQEIPEILSNYPFCSNHSLPDYLSSALWNFRSSINHHKPINEHPIASSLLALQFKSKPLPDEFFITHVLPHIDSFSINELNKRFKRL
ncbi:hypothetical protein SteCoe_19068 [Stentor coeruleus]|uniref:Uncharacterized protein n=1 Tax=Stentor coeruleus TaxID=5963 RepID=A0A1R2BV42_9CILI|nr:hypothetical protein SteCoe_19068 [Stentor coeruleus]